MRHDHFIEILDELQNLLSGDAEYIKTIIQSKGPIQIHYNNQSFYVFRLESWTQDTTYGYGNQNVNYCLLYCEPFEGSIIKDLSKLINYCKKNIKPEVNYDKLLEKVREYCDFQDVLEVV